MNRVCGKAATPTADVSSPFGVVEQLVLHALVAGESLLVRRWGQRVDADEAHFVAELGLHRGKGGQLLLARRAGRVPEVDDQRSARRDPRLGRRRRRVSGRSLRVMIVPVTAALVPIVGERSLLDVNVTSSSVRRGGRVVAIGSDDADGDDDARCHRQRSEKQTLVDRHGLKASDGPPPAIVGGIRWQGAVGAQSGGRAKRCPGPAIARWAAVNRRVAVFRQPGAGGWAPRRSPPPGGGSLVDGHVVAC